MGHCILINLSFHLELAGLQVFFDKLGSFCVAWSSLGKAQLLRRVLGFWRGFKAMGIPSGYLQDLRRIGVLKRILATERVWVVGRVWVLGRVSDLRGR